MLRYISYTQSLWDCDDDGDDFGVNDSYSLAPAAADYDDRRRTVPPQNKNSTVAGAIMTVSFHGMQIVGYSIIIII